MTKYKASFKLDSDYMFVSETFFWSILTDIFSVVMLGLLFWFNYTFINGNNILDLLIVILFVMKVTGYIKNNVRSFESKDDLINYLNNK